MLLSLGRTAFNVSRPILLCIALCAAQGRGPVRPEFDSYTKSELTDKRKSLAAKQTRFAGEDLKKYTNHYTMLAYRSSTGSAEVHDREADIFFITEGECDILLGGTVQQPVTTKPGEIRGASLQGGTRKRLSTGDVIHIDAKLPHQMIVAAGQHVTYFVVKVSGQ